MERNQANGFRWDGGSGGHYESYFQRANHPTRPEAFWIRYTVFVPRGRPHDAVGELWAIHFDGDTGRIVPVKQVVPFARCLFDRHRLAARIDACTLGESTLEGEASCLGDSIGWSLRYTSPEPPLTLLPESLYDGGFPKAKALVGSPLARFSGTLRVNGRTVVVDDWVGSQNHNWGSRHTDEYAWGQVAGFDGHPDSFLELSTARVKLGPLKTPWLTPIVLRHAGREFRLNALTRAARAEAAYAPFRWTFASEQDGVSVRGVVEAPATAFVGLPYDNPPGGRKTCLNSKIARCEVTLEVAGEAPVSLRTAHRAAFEILTDRDDHGVPVLAV